MVDELMVENWWVTEWARRMQTMDAHIVKRLLAPEKIMQQIDVQVPAPVDPDIGEDQRRCEDTERVQH